MAPIPKPAPSPSLVHDPGEGTSAAPPAFPLVSLGPLLSDAASAVAARTQGPVELCAHHILTLAAMAAQRLVSMRLPTGQGRPVSCFFATLAAAGERVGAAEKLIVDEARLWEAGFEKEFPMRLVAHVDDGVETGVQRERPLQRLDLFWNHRIDNRYRPCRRMAGLFARHPFDVIAPGAQAREEAAGLSALWDGVVFTPAGAAPSFPRLSLHLVATPREGRAFLGGPDLYDCGLLSRLLVAAPAARMGTREWSPCEDDTPPPEFDRVMRLLGALYAKHPTTDTQILRFTPAAAALWFSFASEVEKKMAPGGEYAAVRALADRLPEHAGRLAAVIGLMNDCAMDAIDTQDLERGLAFARFYAAEYLRLSELAPPSLSEDEQAELLKDWLTRRAGEGVTLRDICRHAPTPLRNAETAYKIMQRLECSGFVTPKNDAHQGVGRPRRVGAKYLWQVGEASQSVA